MHNGASGGAAAPHGAAGQEWAGGTNQLSLARPAARFGCTAMPAPQPVQSTHARAHSLPLALNPARPALVRHACCVCHDAPCRAHMVRFVFAQNLRGAAAFCASKGSRLATLYEYCPLGLAVFGGRKPDGDHWAPFSGGGDNEWLQVGTLSDHAQCKQHTPAYGKPAWGTGTDARIRSFKKYVLCADAGQS